MYDNQPERGVEFTSLREIKALKSIMHPNIVRLVDVWQEGGSKVCLKMDFYDTDLSKLIDDKRFEMTLPDVKYVMYCVLSAVGFLHENFILHRDVKPSNFVVNLNGDVVLIDFGLARKFASPEKELTRNPITRWYKPPEILYGARFYGEKVDVWSCGCVLAELFLGEPLFPGTSDIDQLSKIFGVRGTPSPQNWPDAPSLPNYFSFEERRPLPLAKILLKAEEEALELIDQMLRLNPAERPAIKELLKAPFFADQAQNHAQFAAKVRAFLPLSA